MPRWHRPQLHAVQDAKRSRSARSEKLARLQRRDGLPRRARDPKLLDLRKRLRAAGSPVRVRFGVESDRAPLPGLSMVRALPKGRHETARLQELARTKDR